MKKLFAAIALILGLSSCALSAEKPIQVTQPAYRDMKFYVYKPVNVPKDFYVTFDGYLVYKNAKGVWNYGSAEKSGIVRTDYVVGAVLPSVVRLKPYSTKISSVAPVLGTDAAEPGTPPEAKYPRVVYMPPSSGFEASPSAGLSPYNPDWIHNSNFMALGKWQKSIDRIGVTYRPMIPVAWKGEHPEVVYAWTGLQWKQLDAKSAHATALSTLRRELYDLTRYIRKVNMLRWSDDDSHVLSHYSIMWGYKWMGSIFLGGDF
ncbi:MAG: hypothetical protein IJT02_09355 [Synergistaceae bacterium]|nr:hypothetical protein [Synergistaceae bacterium]